MRLLLALLVFCAPAAALEATVEAPAILEPHVIADGTLRVVIDCAQTVPQTEISWTVDAPEGLFIDGPTAAAAPTDCDGPTATVTIPLELHATMDLLAEEDHTVTFNLLAGSESTTTTTTLQAAYHAIIETRVDATTKMGAPQKTVPFVLEFDVETNAPTQLTFFVEDVAEGVVVVPEPIIVPGATSATVVYGTPFKNGGNDVTESFTIVMEAKHAITGTFAPAPPPITLEVHTKGLYIPGPFVLPALVFAFLARRA